jgi:DNA-binding NtrC family response regulator
VRLARGQGCLLVVEDEAVVRQPMCQVLKELGYRVLDAAAATEALDLWAGHAAEIDLVLADILLPGKISGLDLAERFLAEKPGLEIILTSGHPRQREAVGQRLASRALFLPKPCPPEILASVIAEQLKWKRS